MNISSRSLNRDDDLQIYIKSNYRLGSGRRLSGQHGRGKQVFTGGNHSMADRADETN